MSAHNNCRILAIKDLRTIFKRSYKHARNMYSKVQEHYGKTVKQPITLKEFCDFYKMEMTDVITILDGKKRIHANITN